MKRAWDDLQRAWHPVLAEPFGILAVLVEQKVHSADADPRRRQIGQRCGPCRDRILRINAM